MDSDKTHLMSSTDDDKTSVMSSTPDDSRTRFMPGGKGQQPPVSTQSAETNDATRLIGEGDDFQESVVTEVMQEATGSGSEHSPDIVDVNAEREAGKTIIKDRFVLDSILGAGGMGSVYKAKDLRKVEARDRNPWLAVKLLNDDFKTHPGAFMSLQREARKSQTLAHPNIVQVFDFDREGDMVYMTMELLEGNDLNHFIKNHPEGVDLEEVLRLTREMGAALQHAHSHNITHADFKPGNVFLSESGTAKVLDFGIAQAVAHADVGGATDDKTAFDPGSLGALTPAYASLEMLQGMDPRPVDDVYALGCIVYQLLCGRHPYDKMPADQVEAKGKPPEKIEKLNRRQWRALQKAVAIKRADRYQTVAEFQKEFAPWANPWVRRLGIAVGIALVLGGVGIYQAVSNHYEEERRTAEVSRMKVRQEVKRTLDARFSELQAEAENVKSQLDQHRFAFEPKSTWKEDKRALLEQLKQLYLAEDWIVVLNNDDTLDESALVLLRKEEQVRRVSASETTAAWIARYQQKVAEDYLELASAVAKEGQFADAQASIDEAERLYPEAPKLLPIKRELEEFIETDRLENKAIVDREAQQRLKANFQRADAAIRADLKTCTKTLSRTGRGGNFSYNIKGLAKKTATLQSNYAALGRKPSQSVAAYVSELGACIQLFGYADPTGAKQQLAIAKQAFPNYAGELSGLSIRPWNTCKPSFAGKGERYDCQDRFLGESRKGPVLVVIPAGNGVAELAIGKYEISEQEFNTWCKETGACEVTDADGALPATGRSVDQVSGYIAWLSESTGFNYQLPTREQWLYAADAGGSGLDPGRNCTLQSRGIVKGQVMLPVELGASNGWGLIHHVGNAREMVKVSNGVQAAGGSRADPMDDCTVQAITPVGENGDSVTGFRVIRARE